MSDNVMVYIDIEERYPEYIPHLLPIAATPKLQVSKETWARWQKAKEDYVEFQEELRKLVNPEGSVDNG